MKNLFIFFCVIFIAFSSANATTFNLVSEEYAPFEYFENGKFVGLDIEILNEIEKISGHKFEIRFVPWKRALRMAQLGTVDGIFCLLKRPERALYIDYPEIPLNEVDNLFFVSDKFDRTVVKMSDLDGVLVGVSAGHLYGGEFDKNSKIIHDESPTQQDVFHKFKIGRYKIVAANEAVGKYYINKFNIEGIRTLPVFISRESYYFGVSKASPKSQELMQVISEGLKRLNKQGKLQQIRSKYLNFR